MRCQERDFFGKRGSGERGKQGWGQGKVFLSLCSLSSLAKAELLPVFLYIFFIFPVYSGSYLHISSYEA
jgi:hypothetical protein